MFDKILIANRGEIACRVIRTARRMGIKTVAVYSEADADALHVPHGRRGGADRPGALGPVLSGDRPHRRGVPRHRRRGGASGLRLPVGESALRRGAGGGGHRLHRPRRPTPSRRWATRSNRRSWPRPPASRPCPAISAPILDEEEAVAVSRRIGYPVMIKASAGGGGKGMRVAGNDDEAREGFRSARNEARSAFGDDRVFAEKYIERAAPHRDPGAGRRARQHRLSRRARMLDPAPPPEGDRGGAVALRRRGDAPRHGRARPCALARAVGYRSAGTVEFIVGADRTFYFLEMNTRLQVEHPVTELVTGLDLVELMIRIAAGEELPFRQEDVRLEGWAIEARVYAEDPLRGFLPSIGRLTRYRAPEEGPQVRVDTGVDEGGEISMHYDPMIAKLIGIGANRNAAIAAIRSALDGFVIRGVSHNIPFLAALMHHPRFVEGRLTTRFIAEEFPDGFHGTAPAGEAADRVAALGAALLHRQAVAARHRGGGAGLGAARRPAEPAGDGGGGCRWLARDARRPVLRHPGALAAGRDAVRRHGRRHADGGAGRPPPGRAAPDPCRRRGRPGAADAARRGAGRADAGQGAARHVALPAVADARPAGLGSRSPRATRCAPGRSWRWSRR